MTSLHVIRGSGPPPPPPPPPQSKILATPMLVTIVRAREHLQFNSNSVKSAIRLHISSCQSCQNCNLYVSLFKVIKNCYNENDTKMQEPSLLTKLTPRLNLQLQANGCSFLLNVF